MKATIIILLVSFIFICCDDNSEIDDRLKNSAANKKLADKFGISLFELENGIGPIKQKINLKDISDEKVKVGRQIFNNKCLICHKLNERYKAPALVNITKKRTPEYILNMILNPDEMTRKHPEAYNLWTIYASRMTNQNLTMDEAYSVLDYLRSAAEQ